MSQKKKKPREEELNPFTLPSYAKEPESILAKKLQDGNVLYKIKWRGHGEAKATWQAKNTLVGAEELIKTFDKANPEAVEDDQWEVECILRKRISHGQALYLTKWKGWADSSNQWLGRECFADDLLVDAFEVREAFKDFRTKTLKTLQDQSSPDELYGDGAGIAHVGAGDVGGGNGAGAGAGEDASADVSEIKLETGAETNGDGVAASGGGKVRQRLSAEKRASMGDGSKSGRKKKVFREDESMLDGGGIVGVGTGVLRGDEEEKGEERDKVKGTGKGDKTPKKGGKQQGGSAAKEGDRAQADRLTAGMTSMQVDGDSAKEAKKSGTAGGGGPAEMDDEGGEGGASA